MNNFIIVFTIFISVTMNAQNTAHLNNKIVIAHRGASGYLPEHTMESKAMAYAMNPDFIEQDLVLSKDNVPIVIHDIYLDDVTNVSEIFPDRKRNDDRFYVIDFTFSELKQLKVMERFDPKTKIPVFPGRFPYNKSSFKLHSFQEEIELIQGLNKSTQNNIGIYPEIKDPEFHRKNGKDISKIVLGILNEYGYKTKSDNCILQCFDASELKRIRKDLKSELFLTQLIEFEEDEKLLSDYATFADAIGPWIKQLIKGYDENGNIIFSDLVKDAHTLGLQVHAYTFRADQLENIPSFEKLLNIAFYGAGIDGAFTDFPDKVVEFLKK
jgi:glycerophosphoryl diester phosphodiesterase